MLLRLVTFANLTIQDLFLLVSTVRTNELKKQRYMLFLVIDCPSIDYLDSLLENQIFKKHQMTANDEADIASLVAHFTPTKVFEHAK